MGTFQLRCIAAPCQPAPMLPASVQHQREVTGRGLPCSGSTVCPWQTCPPAGTLAHLPCCHVSCTWTRWPEGKPSVHGRNSMPGTSTSRSATTRPHARPTVCRDCCVGAARSLWVGPCYFKVSSLPGGGQLFRDSSASSLTLTPGPRCVVGTPRLIKSAGRIEPGERRISE